MSQKLILDLDLGIDDTLALIEAIANPNLDLVGITTTFGNVATEISTQNGLNITDYLSHPEIKIIPGADKALKKEEKYFAPESTQIIHGKNGAGNVYFPESKRKPEDISAADFIIDQINKNGKEITIVATGPLTNLALAELKNPGILKKAGKIVVMGGAVAVEGNINPFAEANIFNDPEAAKIVLEESEAPITLVGLDVTMKVKLDKEEVKEWRKLGDKGNKFADEVDFYIDFYKQRAPKLGGCSLHDPLAVAVAGDPNLVNTIELPIKVDIEGPQRARTVGDSKNLRNPNHKIKVALDVDAKRFEDQLKKDIISVIEHAEKA